MKKKKNESLEKGLLDTINNSDLKDVCIDNSEILVDYFLKDGVLKEIPVVKTLVGLAKAGVTVRERLFVEKVIRFLKQFSKYSSEERRNYFNSLDQDEVKKASQYMILYIDRLDSLEKPQMLGRVFEAYMLGKIDYRKMLYFSHFIDSVFILVWQDYQKEIERWKTRGGGIKIATEDALALEKVGFYEEKTESKKEVDSTGSTVMLKEVKRRLALTNAGWEFIKVVFQMWNDDKDKQYRGWLNVYLK